MSETIRCPNCGRRVPLTPNCERCGEPLPIKASCATPRSNLSEGMEDPSPHPSFEPSVQPSADPVISPQSVVKDKPLTPARPAVPVQPTVPTWSTVPPVQPARPVGPFRSAEPARPVESARPADLVRVDVAAQSAVYAKNATPSAPVRVAEQNPGGESSIDKDSTPMMAGDVPLEEEPKLEIDKNCTLKEGKAGTLKARFVPGTRESCDVMFWIKEHCGEKLKECCVEKQGVGSKPWSDSEAIPTLTPSSSPYSFDIQLRAYQDASEVAFDIGFQYKLGGWIEKWEGTWSVVIKEKVDRSVVNIYGDHASEIKNIHLDGGAKEVNLSSGHASVIEGVTIGAGSDGGGVSRPELSYERCKLFRVSPPPLPYPQPTGAKTDRLILDHGRWRLLLFSGRTVTFGRNRGLCDISWRHPNADRIEHDDPENIPYRKISGQQCSFEHRGDKVALIDGVRDERGIVKPSSYGTFFNAVRVEREKLLVSEGTGRGLVTFSDSAATGTLSVCLPNDVCAKCTRAERIWCGGGKRPSLVFKRLDGVPESAVMVWSCFRLEEADPSFEGVKIFRSDGGFAWRRGRRCGWLVPSESIETECGTVYVRHLPSPAEIAKEKNDVRITSETCHS